MKTYFYTTLLLAFVLFCTNSLVAQTISAGQSGKFGIDGDLWTDVALSGIHANKQAGTHDWFQKQGGTGIGLFDTTGAAAIKQRIMAGENLAFSRRMQYPRYTIMDGDILMDAAYTRDQIGLVDTKLLDKTMFLSTNQFSCKLGDDPTKWKTVPTGGTIPSKTDIIDAYVNMRRNGTTISGNNTSNILLHVGATTLANDGDRYVSFVFLKERMNYDSTNGTFSNSGPAATGGHSAWTFNADSTVKTTGDIAISFNFGSGGVQSIQLLLWCHYTDFVKMDPKRFNFVQGQWYGNDSKSGWGWAAIVREGGSTLQVWGTTNGSLTAGPAWGTSSKAIGEFATNYAAEAYDQYQFAEASIDLTSAGLDFAVGSDNACSPPFTRYFVATRSSSGFSAAMMDFIGPYEFLDAPHVPADIITPGNFNCISGNTITLAAANVVKGASYSWQTADGQIAQSSGDFTSIKVSKPGTYVLTASMVQGCTPSKDTVFVGQDYYKPKAKATNSGIAVLGSVATLYGGDPVASNYMTPFGGSKGLTYRWSKKDVANVLSTWETTSTSDPGTYQLVVTEVRNGCKDTAYTTVSLVADSSDSRYGTLAVKFTDFSVTTDKEKKVNLLSWQMADMNEVERFVVEKSADNNVFAPAGYVFASHANTSYKLSDATSIKANYYRIKAVTKAGTISYSAIIKVKGSDVLSNLAAYNDGSGSIVVNYTTAAQQKVSFAILNFNGQVMKKLERGVSTGSNTFRISDLDNISSGVYLLQATSAGEAYTVKIVL